MKETIITIKRKKIELFTFMICFIIANLANLYSIIVYKTSFVELITSMGYVIVATIIIYFIWSIIRLIFWPIRLLISKKRRKLIS